MERQLHDWERMFDRDAGADEAGQFALLDALPDAVVVTDEAGLIASFNTQAEELFGWSRAEVHGKSIELLVPSASRVDHSRLRGTFSSSPSSRPVRTGKDVRAVRRDGTELDVEVSLAARSIGARRYVVAAIRDRSEHVLALAKQKRTEEQLRQAQKMECIGQLAGGIAHDFNNLITVVLGTSSLLLEELPPDSPLLEDIRQIERAARSSAGLARQLLAFSRTQRMEPQLVAVGDLVVQTAAMLRRVMGGSIELVTSTAAGTGSTRVDPGQLEQVIMNLAINARDAMPQGGKLVIETYNANLDDTCAGEHPGVVAGRYVVLGVRDTGCGMDSDTLERIFEPFFTTKGADRGTGLGLSTVHGIVKQSGGCLTVTSEVGKGTIFRVYLPRADGQPRSAAPPANLLAHGAA